MQDLIPQVRYDLHGLDPTMTYSRDLKNSARRHLEAADLLEANPPPHGRPDVGGYLYGIAAECALKQIMQDVGLKELPPENRRDDPYYHHFPTLKTILRDIAIGRGFAGLRRYAEDPKLMAEWDTNMRYANGKQVLPKNVAAWKEQAKTLIQEMNNG